jgi:photosystem II stability/assembly factor-like uncharacterized protein
MYYQAMNTHRTFIAANTTGLTRAEQNGSGWAVQTLLDGERVECLTADPLNPQTIYAGTRRNGVLCSRDQGRTWRSLGLGDQIVKALAVSPQQPGVMYAGTKPACVFRSRDGGETWDELESFRRIRGRWWWRSPAEPPDWRAYVQGLSLSPTDPNHIAAGIEFGALVISRDGGRSWSNHCKRALRDCHSLTFHAHNGDWIYEGGGGGAAVSRDGGWTWRKEKGMPDTYGWACAADPERPEIWYFSASPMPFTIPPVPIAHIDGRASASIYRSAGGAPPKKLTGGLPQPLNYMAYALLTDPAAPGHLYAGLSSGDIWHTSDYGDSWQKLPVNVNSVQRSLVMLPG